MSDHEDMDKPFIAVAADDDGSGDEAEVRKKRQRESRERDGISVFLFLFFLLLFSKPFYFGCCGATPPLGLKFFCFFFFPFFVISKKNWAPHRRSTFEVITTDKHPDDL